MDRKLTLFSLTWPLFIENFLAMMLGTLSVFMLGHYSDQAVAAVGVSNQVISIFVMLYGIVATGTTVILNQYLGAGRKEQASEISTVAILINLLFGLAMSMIMLFFSKPILSLMNLPDDLMQQGRVFISIVGGASFLQAFMRIMSSISRSHGYTNFPMYIAFGMNLVHATGSYIVLYRPFNMPEFGIPGVAVSLVISEMLGVSVMAYIVVKKLKISLNIKRLLPFPVQIIKSILKVGIPSAGEFLSYNFSQVVITYIITAVGVTALTTKIYTQNLMSLVALLGMTIGQGTMILIGHYIGANAVQKAYTTCIRSMKLAMVTNASMAFIFAVSGKLLLGFFTDDPQIISLGSKLLMVVIIIEPGRVLNMVVSNALRGAGDVRYPVIMGMISMWFVGLPLAYILGIILKLGLIGIWIAFASDEWFRGLIMYFRWRSRAWEKMSLTRNEE